MLPEMLAKLAPLLHARIVALIKLYVKLADVWVGKLLEGSVAQVLIVVIVNWMESVLGATRGII